MVEKDGYPAGSEEPAGEQELWADLASDSLPTEPTAEQADTVSRKEAKTGRGSASERLRLVLDDFKGGGLNQHNLPDAIRQFLGGHDKSSVADFAAILALGSALRGPDRVNFFNQAIDPDSRVTPKSIVEVMRIITSNDREMDSTAPVRLYENLVVANASGDLSEDIRDEVGVLLRVFGIGRVASEGMLGQLDSSEVSSLIDEVGRLENK